MRLLTAETVFQSVPPAFQVPAQPRSQPDCYDAWGPCLMMLSLRRAGAGVQILAAVVSCCILTMQNFTGLQLIFSHQRHRSTAAKQARDVSNNQELMEIKDAAAWCFFI